MKVAIYIRVSTDDQTEESQIKPCENYCKQKGWEVVGIYSDHAKSAYHNVKRPGYDKIMDLVKQNKIDHIVVWAIDRFSRKPKQFKEDIEYIKLHGCQFHSVKESWIESINLPGSMGKLFQEFFTGLIIVIAEMESEKISDRITTSKKFQDAKKKGKVGRPTIDKEVVEKIKEYLRQGKSYRWISANITYKAKYGKFKHPSTATISEISKSLLEKHDAKNNQEKIV